MKTHMKKREGNRNYLLLAILITFLSVMPATAASSRSSVAFTMGGKFYVVPVGGQVPQGCTDQTVSVQYPGTIRGVPSPYATIQQAIMAAQNGDTILVDNGTYTANVTVMGSSSKTLYIYSKNGPGSTTIQGTGIGAVVTFSLNSKSVLSGFTITGGNGSSNGGGIIIGTGATPTISNCIITGNTASLGGGGIHVAPSAAPKIERCIITNNQTTGGTTESNGAAIHVASGATATITNCTIAGNTSSYNGGAIAVNTATLKIINSTLSNNTATHALSRGGAIALTAPNAGSFITNSILWGNTDSSGLNQIAMSDLSTLSGVSYCDVQGSYSGTGNINKDPKFSGGGNYHLQSSSPCIDTGTATNAPDIDIDGNCRPKRGGYDMGSDEVI